MSRLLTQACPWRIDCIELGLDGLRQARERVALRTSMRRNNCCIKRPYVRAKRDVRFAIRHRQHDLAIVADAMQERGGRGGEHDQPRQRRAPARELRLLGALRSDAARARRRHRATRGRARPSDRGARCRTAAAAMPPPPSLRSQYARSSLRLGDARYARSRTKVVAKDPARRGVRPGVTLRPGLRTIPTATCRR